MILSPRESMVRYFSLSSAPKKAHVLLGPPLSKRAAQVPAGVADGVAAGVGGGAKAARANRAALAKIRFTPVMIVLRHRYRQGHHRLPRGRAH